MKYYLSFGMFFTQILIALSQTLEIKAVFDSDTLAFFEPWVFRVTVKNSGDTTLEVCQNFNHGIRFEYGEVSMEMKEDSATRWNSIKVFGNNHHEFNEQRIATFRLIPDEEHASNIVIMPPPIAQINLKPSTTYAVKITYNPLFCNQRLMPRNGEIIFTPQKVFLSNLTPDDSLLYAHLRSLKKPGYFYAPIQNNTIDTSMIDDAESILIAFPNSTILPYFQLYLCYAYRIFAYNHKKDIPLSLYYLRKSKNHGVDAIKSKKSIIVERAEFLLQLYGYFVCYELYSYLEEVPDGLCEEFDYVIEKK